MGCGAPAFAGVQPHLEKIEFYNVVLYNQKVGKLVEYGLLCPNIVNRGGCVVKVGVRKPSVRKSISARTTGKINRTVKKATNPLYGKKGMGYIKNPKKAVYNSVYNKTTIGVSDLVSNDGKVKAYSSSATAQYGEIELTVTNDNLQQIVQKYPQVVETLKSQYESRRNWSIVLLVVGIPSLFTVTFLGIVFLAIALLLFSKMKKFKNAYDDAKYYRECSEIDRASSFDNSMAKSGRTASAKYSVSGKQAAPIKQVGAADNMNCAKYKFSAKYMKTNRMHKNHIVYVFNNESVEDAIRREGYSEPIEYVKEEFPRASDSQVSYLRDKGLLNQPTKLSVDDATAILSKYENRDVSPSESFFKFVSDMRIPMSYYMGSERAYDTLFHQLESRDKLAFFVFSVYRHTKGSTNENMNTSEHKSVFYQFADKMISDDAFLRSLEKINGVKLRGIGTVIGNGMTISGINRNSIAYKRAYEFLSEKELV